MYRQGVHGVPPENSVGLVAQRLTSIGCKGIPALRCQPFLALGMLAYGRFSGSWRCCCGRSSVTGRTWLPRIWRFPENQAPRFLLRDRDAIYSPAFADRVEHMGIDEVFTAHRCPWQNPFVERLIGSIRRECLDYVIVWNEDHLRRILMAYSDYYREAQCHLSLEHDAPIPRAVEPPSQGRIVSVVDGRRIARPLQESGLESEMDRPAWRVAEALPAPTCLSASAKPFRRRSELQSNTSSRSLRWRWRGC